MHVNAEAPSLEPADVLAVVRAFGLLQWWLVDRHEVDLSRRMSPYIDLYPEAYVLLLTASYWFYGQSHWAYLSLLATSTLIDFVAGGMRDLGS